MSTIVPDYSKFNNTRLLRLYDEISGLNEVAAEKLLQELKNRALIEDSQRVEIEIPAEEKKRFDNRMLEVFDINRDEFLLHEQGAISPQYFAKSLSALKPRSNIMFATAIVLGTICYFLFFLINSKIDLFDSKSPSFLTNYFIIFILLILPTIFIIYVFSSILKKKPTIENVSIKKIVGNCLLSKSRVRGTLYYNYYARVKNKKFIVSQELHGALKTDYNLAFYYIEQTGSLLSIEVESSGKYEVVKS